jgi:uncharacterized protein YciI
VPIPRRSFTVLFPIFLATCQAIPSVAPPLELTLVLLKTGPRSEPLSPAERSRVFGGHFGNMQKLARNQQLLVAGPYGQQKSDPRLRGLFVLDTADRSRAMELAQTDPGIEAGVFAPEYHTLSTTAPLREFLAAEIAELDAAASSGQQLEPGHGGRSYVLLTVENGDAAEQVLASHASVLWFARLDGTRALVLLDALDRPTAQTMLQPLLPQLGAIRLDEWYASGHLVDLPKLARG